MTPMGQLFYKQHRILMLITWKWYLIGAHGFTMIINGGIKQMTSRMPWDRCLYLNENHIRIKNQKKKPENNKLQIAMPSKISNYSNDFWEQSIHTSRKMEIMKNNTEHIHPGEDG